VAVAGVAAWREATPGVASQPAQRDVRDKRGLAARRHLSASGIFPTSRAWRGVTPLSSARINLPASYLLSSSKLSRNHNLLSGQLGVAAALRATKQAAVTGRILLARARGKQVARRTPSDAADRVDKRRLGTRAVPHRTRRHAH